MTNLSQKEPGEGRPPLTIVLDTNIWLEEQMLRQSSGSAFRFFLKRQNARLVVPEVVRREVEKNLGAQLIEAATRMRKDHTMLLRILGALKELVLPSDEDLKVAAKDAIEHTRIDVVNIPFTIESASSSLDKCLAGDPPNGPKNQQFKDGVIWADCLRLADEGPVHLVTNDGGFFSGRDTTKGLASNLKAEAEKAKFPITISHKLQSVLEKLQAVVPVDYDQLTTAFLPNLQGVEIPMLERDGFSLGSFLAGTHQLFATDDPRIAHLEFTLEFECVHFDGRKGTLKVSGEASFSPESGLASAIQSRGSEFDFIGEDGDVHRKNAVFLAGSACLGHRTVQHEIRVPLLSLIPPERQV